MRVLLLVETLTLGGLPNYVLELARALQARGDTVAVAHHGGVPTHLEMQDLIFLHLPESGHQEAMAVLVNWRPDIVHVHLCSDLDLLSDLVKERLPLVRTFHEYRSLCLRNGRRRFPGDRCQRALGPSCVMFGCTIGPPLKEGTLLSLRSLSDKIQERDLYQKFDHWVVASRHMKKTLMVNEFHENRISLIPYFGRFDAQASGEISLPSKPTGVPGVDRPIEFLFSGQAIPSKGLKVLVRALSEVDGDWRLTIVADGPDLSATREFVSKRGLGGRMDFKGWLPQPELESLYRNADLLVIPSVWDEPFGLVGLEAMSLETPVLAFPVGGITDYVHEGETGFLAASVSVTALAAGLRRAIKLSADLARFGRNGRQLISERYSRQAHVEALRTIYERASAR